MTHVDDTIYESILTTYVEVMIYESVLATCVDVIICESTLESFFRLRREKCSRWFINPALQALTRASCAVRIQSPVPDRPLTRASCAVRIRSPVSDRQ